MTGNRSKVWCHKEQYCIGTWKVKSMNQGKLEVVKQEMARMNINILGISELKWTGMGEYNSWPLYIYYYGQESLRRNGIALIAKKESEMQYLGAISKRTAWSWFISKANNSTSKSVLTHGYRKSQSWPGLWRPTAPARTNTKKKTSVLSQGIGRQK